MGREELVGYEELVGIDNDYIGDDTDEIGARRRGRVQKTVKADRRYSLGLGSVSVPAGGTAILRGAPSLKFRVDRLMLVPDAPGALVLNIQAGNVSQTLGGQGGPVEAFGPASFGAGMTGQTLDPAIEVVVTLQNPTGGPIQVSGSVFGLADQ